MEMEKLDHLTRVELIEKFSSVANYAVLIGIFTNIIYTRVWCTCLNWYMYKHYFHVSSSVTARTINFHINGETGKQFANTMSIINIVKLGSRSKFYLKSLRELDLELEAIIAMSPPPPPTKHF